MAFIKELGVFALGSRIKNLSELLMRDMIMVYKDHNIDFEPRWFTFFQLILIRKEIAVTEIARELEQTHPAVVQVVNVLEKKKLVVTRTDENDRRKRLVKLSGKGRKLATELEALWKDVHDSAEDFLKESVPDLLEKLSLLEEALDKKSMHRRINERVMDRLLNEIEIIPYTSKHKKDFQSLNEDWLRSYLEISDHDRKILTDPEKEILAKGGSIYVMVNNKQVIGTYALQRLNAEECELSKLTVSEDFRGYGFGRKLLEHAVDTARNSGFNILLLFTHHKLKEATGMYLANGFNLISDHPEFKDITGRCSIAMKRII